MKHVLVILTDEKEAAPRSQVAAMAGDVRANGEDQAQNPDKCACAVDCG